MTITVKKRKSTSISEFWTISEFPDELLLKILSLLPSKDVVATSLLSKRWRSLWEEVKTFRFEGKPSGTTYCKFSRFVNRRSNVESLQLKLDPYSRYTNIKTLVNMAVAICLRELRIEMVYNVLKFPKWFYMFTQLETVILEKLSLEFVPSPHVHMPCLKRLHLLSVRFLDDESVKSLLSICSRLEDLVVRRSSYTNVIIFTIDVPTLKRLSIVYSSRKSRPKCVYGFVIYAPSLRCFSIRDSFSRYLKFQKYMPELVKASVNVVCDRPDKFLGSLASTQYLSLCYVTSQAPYPPARTSFVSLDHLELCSCSVEWWNLLTCLLTDAPKLRVLKLKLYQKHCVQYNEVEGMYPWNQPDFVPKCLSSYLEIFEWRRYNGTEQEREVAKYILANASCLKEATFYSESTGKLGLWKELECVARGSKTCQLVCY